MAKKLIELPKLPRGMGSYTWKNEEHTKIRYRKQITKDRKTYSISVDGDTVAECNTLMKKREEEIIKGIKIAETNTRTKTLEQGMLEWLNLFKSQEVFDKSFDRIESTYTTHVSNTDFGRTQETSITPELIQSTINNLTNSLTGDPLSYSSKKKFYELLNQYFKYKYIRNPGMNPMLTVIKPKKDEKQVLQEELIIWDNDEMQKLYTTAMQPYKPGVGGFKHGTAIIFIMWTFIRMGEALALQWKDIDLENETIKISKNWSRYKIRSGAKAGQYDHKIVPTKGKKTRQYKICKMAVDAISEYKRRKKPESEDDFVFATGKNNKILSETSLSRMYYEMVNSSGLPSDKHVTLHGLRHTGISYFLRNGVPVEIVSRMAGHQSFQITLDIYYQVIEEQKIKAVEDINKYAQMSIL